MAKDDEGNASYKGWAYQKEASAWLLLDLVLARQWCASLTVEPDSHEDAEGHGPVPRTPVEESSETPIEQGASQEDGGAKAIGTNAIEGTLDIQIKRRTHMIWTPATLRDVLTSGSGDSKTPAVERLASDQTRHWILVTNADVNSSVSRHVADSLLPTVASTVEYADATLRTKWPSTAPRVHVLPKVDARGRALEMLRDQCKVVETRRSECLEALCDRITAAWLGSENKEITRENVIEIVRQFGGAPPEKVRADFIHPRQYTTALDQLAVGGVVVVIGPPGVGKTTVAGQLALDLQRRDPPVEVQLHHDPFGEDELAPNARAEARQLQRRCGQGQGDTVDIYTTRLEWLLAAFDGRIPTSVLERLVPLSPESYSRTDKWSLLLSQVASGWRTDWAETQRVKIESALAEPMAYALYGGDLARCPMVSAVDHKTWVHDAQVSHIHIHIADLTTRMSPSTAVADAMALWLLLSGQRRRDRWSGRPPTVDLDSPLRELRQLLRRAGIVSRPGALRDRLHSAGRLRGEFQAIRAHAEVVRGLRVVLQRAPEATEDLVLRVLDNITTPDTLEHWLRHLKLLFRWLRDGLPVSIASLLHQHIELPALEALDRPEFPRVFWRLGEYGDPRTPLARLANALHDPHNPPDRWFRSLGFDTWAPPSYWTDEERHEVAASEDCQRLAAAFIRHELADSIRFGDGSLARFFREMGWAESLAVVAHETLRTQPFITPARDLALLALAPEDADLDGTLLAIDMELSELESQSHQTWQLELDASYMANDLSDEAANLEARILAVVETARARYGWRWIAGHPLVGRLVNAWAHLVIEGNGGFHLRLGLRRQQLSTPQDELAMLWSLRAHSRERVAQALAIATPTDAAPLLQGELIAPTDPGFRSRARGALAGLLVLDAEGEPGVEQLAQVSDALSPIARAVLTQILQDPPSVGALGTRDRAPAFLNAINISQEALWCLSLERSLDREETWPALEDLIEGEVLDDEASRRIRVLAAGDCPRLAAQAITMLALLGELVSVEELKRVWRLLDSWDHSSARLILRIAVLLGEPGMDFCRQNGLQHEDYRVRKHAVWLLGQGDRDTQVLLSLAQDPSGPVRVAVLQALRRRPAVGDRRALLEGVLDTWNSDPHYAWGREMVLEVARTALATLKDREPLTESEKATLQARLDRGVALYQRGAGLNMDDWTFLRRLADYLHPESSDEPSA